MAMSQDSTSEKEKAMIAVQDDYDLYQYMKRKKGEKGFDHEFLEKMELVDASPSGECVWELEITPFYANLDGVMHGGAAAPIFDMCTSTALSPVAKPGYWDSWGVTRTLNISYLRPTPLNTKLRLVSKVLQHGKTMAMIQGRMESLDGTKVYTTCEHHKVNVVMSEQMAALMEKMKKKMKEEKLKGSSVVDGEVAKP